MIPPLEPHCGSWIIIDDDKPIMETFSARTALKMENMGYTVMTALEWLCYFNKEMVK